MPEAEDVILEASERAVAAARALWRRKASPDTRCVALDELERTLGFLLTACVGGHWPLVSSDAPSPAGWLSRRLGRPPPWELEPPARGFSDGTQIFLPRRLELGKAEIDDGQVLRLLALSLGQRIQSGSLALCPARPV